MPLSVRGDTHFEQQLQKCLGLLILEADNASCESRVDEEGFLASDLIVISTGDAQAFSWSIPDALSL